MTPWDKTLHNFQRAKNSSDASERAYWRSGEMVPIHELLPYREWNRKTQEKYPGHFNDVKSHIEKNGITDMGILSYNPQTHRVYQSEGNTRLAIAHELGFTHVPVRVYRVHHENKAGGIAPQPHRFQGHVPADIRPSEIGFSSMNVPVPGDDGVLDSLMRQVDAVLSEQVSPKIFEQTKFDVPGLQNVRIMVDTIVEGNFDWSELDRLYGQDFTTMSTSPSQHVGFQATPAEFHEIASGHNYKHIGDVGTNSIYMHPDGHVLDIRNQNHGSWVHTPVHSVREEDSVWGEGLNDLKHHLQSFHRSW